MRAPWDEGKGKGPGQRLRTGVRPVNLIDTGAIMAFESGPGPPLDGIAQPGGSLVTVTP
jgi:hypothetical protein